MEKRLIYFYSSRLFTFLVFFVVVVVFNAFRESEQKTLSVLLFLFAYALFNLIYFFIPFLREKLLLILSLDAFFVSFLVYKTGTVNSKIHILYLILVAFAGFYLKKEQLYFLATICVLSFMGVVYFSYFMHSSKLSASSFYDISYPVAVYFVAIYTIALIIIRINNKVESLRGELRLKERELWELAQLKNKIVDTIQSGIITTDKQFKVNFINPQGKLFLTKTFGKGDFKGKDIREIFPVSDFIQKLDHLDRFIFKINGRIFGLNLVKLYSRKGFDGILAVFQDLTEIKEMERRAQFKDKMTELGELSASFAHEVRNPLASIKGAIQLLKETECFDGELIEVIEKEVERLNISVEEFLRFSRTDYHKPEFAPIVPVVREAVEKFEKEVSDGVVIEYIENLDGKEKAFFEKVRLGKVIWNLLKNAEKAVEHGETKNIKVKLSKKGGYVVIEVEDTGIGIKDADKSKIFEPYYSGFSKGMGVGLALSKAFVEDMDGKIEFESVEGQGSVFRIFLKSGEKND